MTVKPAGPTRRLPRKASDSRMLKEDVGQLVREYVMRPPGPINSVKHTEELAHDIIVVVRERVLREIESYARENIQ